jgi:isopentenyl diphosphate isomerase/L-lactate dehydrogenase-like FMN-dependent dehydrogenase
MLLNIDDYRAAARRRLPKPVFDIIDGGAADEITLRRNRNAFTQIALRPRSLGDVTTRDMSTTILGEHVAMPIMLDPAGFAGMANRQAELAVARAAAAAGVVYAVSTVTSYPLEEVAHASTGSKWFQLYPPSDQERCAELIGRAKGAGYNALCVTIDGAVGGNRERDRRNRIKVPLRVTPAMIASGVLRPRWSLDFLRGGVGRGLQGLKDMDENNFTKRTASIAEAGRAIVATARSVSADEIAFIRDRWSGPLVIKGVQRAEEIDLMLGLGADGFVVSNHGGRQLDTVLPTIEILPEVVHAVNGRAEVFVDSGFRRGTDVAKALALGARAVLVGRPYFYGLAVGGEAGVAHVIEILRSELDNTMALLGCATLGDLDRSAVQLLPGFAGKHD